jgi:Tfp pilus assembly protein PilF
VTLLAAWWRGLPPGRRLEPVLFVAFAALLCNLPFVSSRPMEALTQTNLGIALEQGGRPADAEARYREAIRLSPRNAAAHNRLGIVLVSMGRVREGIAEFRAALEIQPTFTEANANLQRALAMTRAGGAPSPKPRFG